MTTPKWTEERTEKLVASIGDERPVSRDTVIEVADILETSTRSVSSKLRKIGIEVEKASAAPKAFSDEATEQLRNFVLSNSGQYTYAEIAEALPGSYTTKAVQGKILSMELTSHVKETPKQESTKTYTEAEEAKMLEMIAANKYVEDIAQALDKRVESVRGKALSLLRAGQISSMPKQRDVKGPVADIFEGINISDLKVSEIAEKTGKTERGIKTILTRRHLVAADYDGAAKAAKAAKIEKAA